MNNKPMVLAAAAAILSLASAPPIVNCSAQPRVVSPQGDEKGRQTFTGTIVKNGDDYILDDTANKVTYELDNPQEASVFLGKKVKVIGALDEAMPPAPAT